MSTEKNDVTPAAEAGTTSWYVLGWIWKYQAPATAEPAAPAPPTASRTIAVRDEDLRSVRLRKVVGPGSAAARLMPDALAAKPTLLPGYMVSVTAADLARVALRPTRTRDALVTFSPPAGSVAHELLARVNQPGKMSPARYKRRAGSVGSVVKKHPVVLTRNIASRSRP